MVPSHSTSFTGYRGRGGGGRLTPAPGSLSLPGPGSPSPVPGLLLAQPGHGCWDHWAGCPPPSPAAHLPLFGVSGPPVLSAPCPRTVAGRLRAVVRGAGAVLGAAVVLGTVVSARAMAWAGVPSARGGGGLLSSCRSSAAAPLTGLSVGGTSRRVGVSVGATPSPPSPPDPCPMPGTHRGRQLAPPLPPPARPCST